MKIRLRRVRKLQRCWCHLLLLGFSGLCAGLWMRCSKAHCSWQLLLRAGLLEGCFVRATGLLRVDNPPGQEPVVYVCMYVCVPSSNKYVALQMKRVNIPEGQVDAWSNGGGRKTPGHSVLPLQMRTCMHVCGCVCACASACANTRACKCKHLYQGCDKYSEQVGPCRKVKIQT
jgi:hypothetical protein